ncbi:PHP domain-containing protein [Candidatus Bathyarchaeota archaeon]|nr:PHP domain-containing protein [Candidatus Bathyarchaeota archaeon]
MDPQFMIIDLHIHSKTCSDGNLSIEKIIKEAKIRNINLMSITDHDSIGCQEQAKKLAKKNQINYINGVELNITFSYPNFINSKPVSLDLLSYQYDTNDKTLQNKLKQISQHREERAIEILRKLNIEFKKEGQNKFTKNDLKAIQKYADGVLGRPHIADHIVSKGIVKDRKEAFEKYLVKCDVPKFPLCIEEASNLLRNAGGLVVLAHPNDPYGTSLVKLTNSLQEQTQIIQEYMLPHIDGIECWHSRNTTATTIHYMNFSKEHDLLMTGGSDCHQNPVIMGTTKVPDFVAKQFLE